MTKSLRVSVLGIAAAFAMFGSMNRVAGAAKAKQPETSIPPVARLMPETSHVVRVSDSGLAVVRPDKTKEKLSWSDLQSVEIVNTDDGPMVADVFWVLNGSNRSVVIPQGATGEEPSLARLQMLPGFDNGSVIKAMTVSTNMRTLCWRRPGSGS